MKQYRKIILNIVYAASLTGLITACGGGGGGAPADPGTGGGSSLTVSSAPASVAGSFVPGNTLPQATIFNGSLGMSWNEQNGMHSETIGVKLDLTTGQVLVAYSVLDGAAAEFWGCDDHIAAVAPCANTTIDQTNGIVTFTNQVLVHSSGVASVAVTLNGTLKYRPPGSTGSTGTGSSNNSALLNGAALGKNTTALSELRKPIAVQVSGASGSLSVGTVYATRPNTITDYAYVIVPLTNTGNVELCFVKLGAITYRDASDMPLVSNALTYVHGTVARVSFAVYTDSCLLPGEKGMAVTVTPNIYTAVAKMEFTLEVPAYVITSPAASVIPQSYTVQTAPTADTVSIVALNEGTANALVGEANRFHMWFLLDDMELPQTFGFTDTASPGVISAAAITTITSNVYYDGPAGNKLLVYVNFADTALSAGISQGIAFSKPVTNTCSPSLPQDELMLCRLENRNQHEATLEANFAGQ